LVYSWGTVDTATLRRSAHAVISSNQVGFMSLTLPHFPIKPSHQ
jgi:hypothetical protein